ncbi:hypothetical protein Salat_1104400 [Sesamum alatum]|uniref:Reverse transcriptase n=1 Tax=Sesamum alatum TaxID=300844 RepID=A0AAE1YNC5_9LAMI|nr:hypothetical protein Salat_1104400 [Sesamum alatum]
MHLVLLKGPEETTGQTSTPHDWKTEASDTVWKRLDRACTTSDWYAKWPNSQVRHLQRVYSDHCPILFERTASTKRGDKQTQRPGRFEALWIKSEMCEEAISNLWGNLLAQDPSSTLISELEHCKNGFA